MIPYQTLTKAHVYLRETLAGTLHKEAADKYSFHYHTNYLKKSASIPIACVFPLRPQPYVHRSLHPFFDNLILEGWLLAHAEGLFHIDKKNRFALLMAVGRFPIGAVSLHPLDPDGNEYTKTEQVTPESEESSHTVLETITLPHKEQHCPACLQPSSQDRILHARCAQDLFDTSRKLSIELDRERPLETFSKTIYGGSISGAQKKGLFFLDTKSGVLKSTPFRAQYILKPDGDYPELPANEHLTMAIARKAGLSVAPFCLIQVPKLGFVYLTRRFDCMPDFQLRRMEDMAQIIGTSSEDKYHSSNEKVARAIQENSAIPPLDSADFFKRLLFCFLVGNADMHLKNWSLLEQPSLNGEMDLSPCYDLLNTRLAIPKESIDIGLSLNGKSRKLQSSYFKKFAKNILKLDDSWIKKQFKEIETWLQIIEELTPKSYLSEKSALKYLKITQERLAILLD